MSVKPGPRPTTDGCSEWSCIYHGAENRQKAEHDAECDVRSFKGFRFIDGDRVFPPCTCSQKAAT